MIWVYIVRCSDGSYYVGSTRAALERRIAEHNAGHYNGYTANRRPVELVWQQAFAHATDAIAAERQIKGWSRAKKEALVAGDFATLHMLAKRRASASAGRRPKTQASSREREKKSPAPQNSSSS